MIRPAYDTDLTNDQWEILKSLIPESKTGGRPRTLDMREVLNAIFYLLSNGIKWRARPMIYRSGKVYIPTFVHGRKMVHG
jgi:putative transposase